MNLKVSTNILFAFGTYENDDKHLKTLYAKAIWLISILAVRISTSVIIHYDKSEMHLFCFCISC